MTGHQTWNSAADFATPLQPPASTPHYPAASVERAVPRLAPRAHRYDTGTAIGMSASPWAREPRLTAEELLILRHIADGLPIESVAHRIGISPRTVRRRMRTLCDRIGATCVIQAVVWAAHEGLV